MRKKILLILTMILALATLALADTQALKFTWQQPGDLSNLAGWKVYSSTTAGGPYTLFSQIAYDGAAKQEYTGNATITQAQGTKKTYYFTLTAFGKNGMESGKSNEVSTVIDFTVPSIPVSFTVQLIAGP